MLPTIFFPFCLSIASTWAIWWLSGEGALGAMAHLIHILSIAWIGAIVARRVQAWILLSFLSGSLAALLGDVLLLGSIDYREGISGAFQVRLFGFALVFWVYGLIAMIGGVLGRRMKA